MATVLLRLSGPMQAYGTSSHWEERATRSRPTKSAVIGLIVNALGLSADTPLDDFTSMTFAVRADRPGRQMRDEQTMRRWPIPSSRPAKPEPRPGLWRPPRPSPDTRRHAPGLTEEGQPPTRPRHKALPGRRRVPRRAEHRGPPLSHTIDNALRRPARLLFLGRHCCPPAQQIAHGVTPHGPDQWPSHISLLPEATDAQPAVWTEVPPTTGAFPSSENPVSFTARHHTTLFLRTSTVLPPAPELQQ